MPAPERNIGKLVLSVGGRILRELLIDRKRVTIGRRPYNDLLLDDLTVSGEHAIVHTGPQGESVVHDLQSRNGTLVNGAPVMQQVLTDGDVIDVGIYRIVYRTEVLEFNVNDFAPPELPRAPLPSPVQAPSILSPGGFASEGRPNADEPVRRGAAGVSWSAFLDRRRPAGTASGSGPGTLSGGGSDPAKNSAGSVAGGGFPPILPRPLPDRPLPDRPPSSPTEASPPSLPALHWPGGPASGASGTGSGTGGPLSSTGGPASRTGETAPGDRLPGSARSGDSSPGEGDAGRADAGQPRVPFASPSQDPATGQPGGHPTGQPRDPSADQVRPFDPPKVPSPVEPWRFGRVVVRYLGGHDAGREVVMDRPIVSIRNGSGQVAVIARRHGGYYLTHVEGLAYPLVNGESIGLGAHALRDNDLIELAGTILQFCLASGPS